MKIKEIELIGFKSFSDRTALHLHNGITCIVGPNGCGKSNIVDAFRWVLGEQSAKSLRGEKMEEVIFQGSATKKLKGMAEVALTISQSNQLPMQGTSENGGEISSEDGSHDEIIVSRRLYRSGESEYLLNKKQCRLKDIRDIFLDTGLDVKSYSILDQGRITEILNTKPHERRFLIEEVAGVMKYKVRKAEALSKLESSKENLQRINDIVYEVKRQINSLDRQVKKAERYKRLTGEIKVIDMRIAKREHIRLTDTLNALLSEIERLRGIDSAKRGELSTLENTMEIRRLEIAEKENALAELEKSLHEKEKVISETEKNIAILKTNIENKKADISRLTSQIRDTDAKKEELLKKSSELDETEGTYTSNMEAISAELKEKKELASTIEMTIAEKESGLENKRKDLFKISEDLSNKRNELHKLQSSYETLNYRESVSLNDMDTIKSGLEKLGESIRETEEFIRIKSEERAKLQSERDALSVDTANMNGDIENKKTLLSREREELAAGISRLNSLRELIIDRSLMDFLLESRENLRFAGTVLSDIINADRDFEMAIEAALSEKINSLIIDNIDDVIAASKVVKEKHLGRTAILYTGFRIQDSELREQKSEDTSRKSDITHHHAYIGSASDLIKFENIEAENIAGKILKNVYVVKDLRSAIELQNELRSEDLTLVTLEGEVFTPDGFIFTGHGKEILKRKREIKELQKSVDRQQTIIRDIENELESLNTTLTLKRENLKNIENLIIDLEKETSLSEQSLKNLNDELDRNTRRLSFLDAEISTILQEKESIKNILESKTEEINLLEKESNTISDGITEIQESLASIRTEYEDKRTQLEDMRLAIAAYREKIEALRKERANITDTVNELENQKASAAQEIQDTEGKIAESLRELNTLEENVKAIVAEADKIRKEREDKKENIISENQELISKEGLLKKLRIEIDSLSQEISDNKSNSVENRLRIENIENSIFQKYGLEIAKEEIQTEGFEPSEDENTIIQLNEKIKELGPVNLGTIEEYEELKTRYDFLTKQQKDLTMSIAELEEAISRINTTTKRKLREAFDALRAKFSEVFLTLFGGGRADIILTDEENILESGLEIIAQLPGKKLQNLNLLSGGEKALTSLALLFAGFLIKPSPLCILDEVDAPLDESNTVRFAQMLKGLSQETQFIIITHNRTTMEVADYLYGITMEEPGISKAISLQFSEVESTL
jgi:chromosome segregation protein